MKTINNSEITTCARYSSTLQQNLLIKVVKGIYNYIKIKITGAGIRFAGQKRQKAKPMSKAPTNAIANQGAYYICSNLKSECIAS